MDKIKSKIEALGKKRKTKTEKITTLNAEIKQLDSAIQDLEFSVVKEIMKSKNLTLFELKEQLESNSSVKDDYAGEGTSIDELEGEEVTV